MKRTSTFHAIIFSLLVVFAGGCDFISQPPDGSGSGDVAGMVYTMSNTAGGNEVVLFHRDSGGALTRAGTFSTGGQGSGPKPFKVDPLGSQDPLILSADHRLLFAVNAGSNSISSFRVGANGRLTLANVVASGGGRPVSLTYHDRLLYAVNAANGGNIKGFQVASNGNLKPLSNSSRPLSGADVTGPGTIQFTPNGRQLVVAEKATSKILVYPVNGEGRTSEPVVQDSEGRTPFGAEFTHTGTFIVSETNVRPPPPPRDAVPGESSVSSYTLGADGQLSTLSASVTTNETAACWIEITADEEYAYATNTGSGSVTSFGVSAGGSLTRLTADGRTGLTGEGTHPLGMAISGNYLYVLVGGEAGKISAFSRSEDGGLIPVGNGEAEGFAPEVEGIAAW